MIWGWMLIGVLTWVWMCWKSSWLGFMHLMLLPACLALGPILAVSLLLHTWLESKRIG